MKLFKKTTDKGLIPPNDQLRITNAIAKAEITTSGEIRVFMERHCPDEDPVERAAAVFYKLEMDETQLRNAVLIYLALDDKKAALFGDEGIYKVTGGARYWEQEYEVFTKHLRQGELVEGMERIIGDLGYSLAKHFPYMEGEDKNELPDEIVFGA